MFPKNLFSRMVAILAVLTLATQISFAGVNAAPYLRSGVGAKSLGMAGAVTAISDDATATIWNPAGTSSVNNLSFTLATAKLDYVSDRYYDFIGVVKKLNETSSIGLSIINFGVGYIPQYSDSGESIGEDFDYNANAFTLSYGHALDQIKLGASFRILSDSFTIGSDEKQTGFGGLDLGVRGALAGNALNYGVVLKNLGGKIADGSVPATINLGAAYTLKSRSTVTIALDLEHQFVEIGESTTSVRIGAEYRVKAFSIRGGTHTTSDRTTLYGGFGVSASGIQIDYAIRLNDTGEYSLIGVDNHHLISLSYGY